jgi:NAD(P)-dependent dehydrogenase (short-subunit alcohol dehydrogenase family)
VIALVTGGNRGIGLEVCRQLAANGHDVILGSRDRAKGERVAGDLRVVEIDVADDDSVTTAAAEIEQLDVLVNNAAILYDTWARASSADLARGQRLERERRAERDARRYARVPRE